MFKNRREALDRIKFISTILMALSLPFSESLKTIGILLAFIVFSIQMYRKEIDLKLSTIHYGFILFLLSSFISSIFSADTVKSLAGSKDILFYTIPFFVACSINNEKKIRAILWCLYISTALSATSGIFHSIAAQRPLEIHALGNQNYTCMFFMIIITSMISTTLFSDKENFFKKSVLVIFSIITMVASVMTLMRASFLGLFAFLASALISEKRSRLTLLISMGFIGLIALAVYADKAMWLKLLSTHSMVSRLDIWGHAINLFIENPLTGIGLNHFSHRFPFNHPVEPNNTVYDAHSLYLQVASQMGVIGIMSLTLIIAGFIRAWKNLTGVAALGRALKFGAMGAFLVITVTGLFDTTLHHENAIAFTMLAGLMFGYLERPEKTDGI